MTDETTKTDQEPTNGQEGQQAAEGLEALDAETFGAEYVQGLRQEAADNRVKAKRATALEQALRDAVIDHVAGRILSDVSALEWSDDFNDTDGMPDHEKVRAAAEAIAQGRPHLARVRGDVNQGHRGDASGTEVNLAEMLRAGL